MPKICSKNFIDLKMANSCCFGITTPKKFQNIDYWS